MGTKITSTKRCSKKSVGKKRTVRKATPSVDCEKKKAVKIAASVSKNNNSLATIVSWPHCIVDGKYKGFKGEIIEDKCNNEGDVSLLLYKNARGGNIKRGAVRIEVAMKCVRETDSRDMLQEVDTVDATEEDPALLKAEKTTWECKKCHAQVLNDNGFCPEIVNGVRCMGTRVTTVTATANFVGWGDLFQGLVGFNTVCGLLCVYAPFSNTMAPMRSPVLLFFSTTTRVGSAALATRETLMT